MIGEGFWLDGLTRMGRWRRRTHFCCLTLRLGFDQTTWPSDNLFWGRKWSDLATGLNGRSTNDLLNWDFCLRTTFLASDSSVCRLKHLGNASDSLCLVFLGRTVLNKTKFFKDNFYWEKGMSFFMRQNSNSLNFVYKKGKLAKLTF